MSRSFQFIPGNTPSMIQNMDVFESDSIIIDLEDSVTLTDKDAARVLVHEFLSKYQFDMMDIYIRINSTDTPFFKEDITLLDSLDFKGYVLPKATPQSVEELEAITKKDIIPIIESPLSFLRVEDIAQYKQVTGLLLGAEDFTKDLGVKRTLKGTEIEYVRSHIAIVASAYNILSIDTPFIGKDKPEDLEYDARHAKELGFTSKSSIHPNHVTTINTVFAPSKVEINQALRIIMKSETENKGAFSLDGKMVDAPIIEKAKKTIKLAKKYNLL